MYIIMRLFLWQLILLGFAARSTAIYKGDTSHDTDAIGVVRVKSWTSDQMGSGVALGNGKCVITAAHVVYDKKEKPGDMYVFENQVKGGTVTTYQTVNISSINIHDKYVHDPAEYDPKPSPYDLAVIQLTAAIKASPWKISLTQADYDHDFTMFGWGQTSGTSETTKFPSELAYKVNKNAPLDGPLCNKWQEVTGGLCATTRSTENKAEGLNCGGDSGGPSIINAHVIGVTSMTDRPCGMQSAGLLSSLAGSKQNSWLRNYEQACGFVFGQPILASGGSEIMSEL